MNFITFKLFLMIMVEVGASILDDLEFEAKKERWSNRNSYTPSHHGKMIKRVKVDSDSQDHNHDGLCCLACLSPISYTSSMYVNMLMKKGTRRLVNSVSFSGNTYFHVDTVKEVVFGERTKGRICSSCYERLRNLKEDIGGTEEQVIQVLIDQDNYSGETEFRTGPRSNRGFWTGRLDKK